MKKVVSEEVPAQIKNQELIDRRRRQIVDAAVELFVHKGFHKTTTREIAHAAGMSTGLLYEYVASKEDVLFLVCDAIHAEVEAGVSEAKKITAGARNVLSEIIRRYFLVCDRMSDHILLVYQETGALPAHWRKRVLENEVKITGIFVRVLKDIVKAGDLPAMNSAAIDLMAHNIAVLGHMWTFRRWYLKRHFNIDDYIAMQTDFILGKVDSRSRGPSVKNKETS